MYMVYGIWYMVYDYDAMYILHIYDVCEAHRLYRHASPTTVAIQHTYSNRLLTTTNIRPLLNYLPSHIKVTACSLPHPLLPTTAHFCNPQLIPNKTNPYFQSISPSASSPPRGKLKSKGETSTIH